MEAKKPRKRRSDRNHVIYLITCVVTGETYIGLTVVRGQAIQKSVRIRWVGHIYHALVEQRPYRLHEAIRLHGPENFHHEVLMVIRGKAESHRMETSLIRERMPALNTESTGRKAPRKRSKDNSAKAA